MNLTVDTKLLLDSFFTPISKITDECSIFVTSNSIHTLIANPDGTLIHYNKISATSDTEKSVCVLNFKDVKKILRVLQCVTTPTITLNVDDNNSMVSYKSKNLSFKVHLVNDNVVRKCPISLEKISKFTFNTQMVLNNVNISNILKGSVFTPETNKLYFYTKDGAVYAELTDHSTQDLDSITFNICENYTGDELTPLPFNLEFLRLISNCSNNDIFVRINTSIKILMFEIENGTNIMKYIVSAYTK